VSRRRGGDGLERSGPEGQTITRRRRLDAEGRRGQRPGSDGGEQRAEGAPARGFSAGAAVSAPPSGRGLPQVIWIAGVSFRAATPLYGWELWTIG
jgi:hypothetical protein